MPLRRNVVDPRLTKMHDPMNKWQRTVSNWSEMWIPSQDREHFTATMYPEVRRSVRKAHRRVGHPPLNQCTKTLKLGEESNAALELHNTGGVRRVRRQAAPNDQ